MVRKLSLAVALVLGVSPLASYAVGLGNIHLNSALNQYFDADIDLLSVEQDELSDIKVTLASTEAFRRSGIERPFVLTKLRFQPEQNEEGKTVIRVSSRDPIREPFLNFLIEVNWPKGRLVREYTVLLDPPATLERKPAPVEQPAMQSRAPVQQTAEPESTTIPSATPESMAGEYGPTQRNDTLWGIAKRYRVEGASMEQMMLALQRANPQAFIDQNINKLKTGQILRIPQADEVLEMSRREATNEYRDQLQEWQADRAPVERMADEEGGVMPSSTEGSSTGAELKIASARPSGEGTAGPSEGADDGEVLEQLKQDLMASEEAKQAALQEAEVARSRVEDLESQLEDLQRLYSLKSDQLAQLQNTAEEAQTSDSGMAMPAEEMASDSSPVMEDEGTQGESPILADEGETTSPVMEQEPVPAEQPKPATMAEQPAVKAEAPVKKAPPPAMPKKEESFLDTVMQDPTLLGAGVAGILVLLALGWVVISRRRSSRADFQESILINTIDDTDSEQLPGVVPEADDPASHSTEETSFLSDFSPSDIDALQDETGEVDPMAEADVYIAYGRYQQAEELIRQAIDKDPERVELKHKLFEILFATKDKDGFVALAESASAEGLDKKDANGWAKVVDMGAKLAAGHALFSGGSTGGMDDDDLASLEDELSLDSELGLDEPSSSVDLISEAPGKTEEEDDTLGSLSMDEASGLEGLDDLDDLDDLSLDSDLEPTRDSESDVIDLELDEVAGAADEVGTDTEPSLDAESFSLDDLDTDLSIGEKSESAESDSEDFSLTLDSLDSEESLDEESAFSIEDPLETAELDDLEVDIEEDTASEPEAESLDEGVIDFSDSLQLEEGDSQVFDTLELEQVEAATDDGLESDSFSLDDLDQDDEDDSLFHEGGDPGDKTDEVNTKLDLARAYVDMEDAEGARSILEEVLKEGSEGQQNEAQALLDKLS